MEAPITITNVHYRGTSSVEAATQDPPERFLHPDGPFDALPTNWLFSAGVNPAPAGLLRPRCGNGIVDVGEACDSAGVGVDFSGERGCTATCDVVGGYVCGGPLSICLETSGTAVVEESNDTVIELNDAQGGSGGLVYLNVAGVVPFCLQSSNVTLALIAADADVVTLVCATGHQAGHVALSGITLNSAFGANTPAAVTVTSGRQLLLANAKVTNSRAGVQVNAGANAVLAAVEITGTEVPLVFQGSGRIVNSLAHANSTAVSLAPADGEQLTGQLNTFVGDGSVCSPVESGSLTLTDTILSDGDDRGCSGQDVLNTSGMLSGRLPAIVPAGVIDECGAGAADLGFDVDLQRRPVGAAFDCGADEASR
jgi:hypothetical protein